MAKKPLSLKILTYNNFFIDDTFTRENPMFATHPKILGEEDEGFEWLGKEYEVRDARLPWIKVDPVFDRFRSNSKFITLLNKIGLEK